jgi:peroxiredoxin Q/BCP
MSDIKIAVGDHFPIEKLGASGPAVVYVYPKDSTSGCELESRGFNTLYDDFKGLGVDILGVSAGTSDTSSQFASECDLKFKLVPSPEVIEELALLKDFGQYGILPRRITFLVGKDGTVEKIWDVEDIQSHPGEVLAAARAL